MAMLDVVKYNGNDSGDWLIYKYPSENFRIGSQLIVNQSQEALFLKGGKALDLFGPATHTLKTGNIPLLDKLVNLPFGGQTPFTAEVYFINKTFGLSNPWGTSSPIQLIDSKYEVQLNVRAFGTFSMAIADSRLFVEKIIGATKSKVITNAVVKDYISSMINEEIKSTISGYMKKVSIYEITTNLKDISKICFENIQPLFEMMGLNLISFVLESINTPKEDREKIASILEKRAELKLLGENYYRQRQFDVLDNLAENEGAGGLASAGMGLGMGLGAGAAAGQMFGNAMSEMNVQPTHMQPMNQMQQPAQGATCPQCAYMNDSNSKFCANCGQGMQPTKKACHSCSEQIDATVKFCNACGANQQHTNCTNCGEQNDVSSKFCCNCGSKC